MPYEYTRFGESFLRREEGSTDDWVECQLDDIPQDFFDVEKKISIRRQAVQAGGIDPFRDDTIPDGAEVIVRKGKLGAVRLANPEVDAMATELGLTPNELRERLNGTTGGTRNRVDESRFDEIANKLGLTPENARARFRE